MLHDILPVPNAYYIAEDGITISRLNSKTFIPHGEIIDIKNKKDMSMTFWIGIGNRDLLGWACVAYSGRYGWVRIYHRKFSSMVFIDTLGKKYLIAPENPESFIRETKQMISITRTYRGDDYYGDDNSESDSGFAEVVDENGFPEVLDY
ncbi:MAG: PH domain-containing protein [Candidatus Thermoplasmatota archaeon]|nr:PH domain-containing protein [Candidatus Thermoplasmatota archaeon]MDP7264681.1 PH domain-containing protein [Candidatus Thermoplasmatota archaeon]